MSNLKRQFESHLRELARLTPDYTGRAVVQFDFHQGHLVESRLIHGEQKLDLRSLRGPGCMDIAMGSKHG